MPSAFTTQIADTIGGFLQSDAWRVLEYRIGVVYRDTLQNRVNINVKAGDKDKAQLHLGMMCGVNEAIDITERIVGELKNGKLDADVALSVIENKQRNEEIQNGGRTSSRKD